MKIYITASELCRVQEFFFNDFKSGIAQKLRKAEQSFLCGTLCLDLIYISVKYHECILKIVYGQRHAIIRPVLSKIVMFRLKWHFSPKNQFSLFCLK